MSSETIAALIGVVLGAVIGGFINWLIARSNFKREKRAELNIRRKSRLYAPLRTRLLQFQLELNQEPFPDAFKVEPYNPRIRNSVFGHGPDFAIWKEMKDDARLYHVPRDIRERLDGFIEKMRQYNNMSERFAITCNNAWIPIYEGVTKTVTEAEREKGDVPNYTISAFVLDNSPEGVASWFKRNGRNNQYDVWLEAGERVIEEVGNDPGCLGLRILWREIQEQTESLITLFSREIENIVTMYEGRKCRWSERTHHGK